MESWTLSFIREWWPYMGLRSVIRFRDYSLRSEAGAAAPGRTLELRMKKPVRGKVSLREVGSDVLTFHEVFKEQVYAGVASRLGRCETVIDLGGNIGLATLYFAHRYPGCRLLTVEPNPPTYELLARNVEGLVRGGRCRTLMAAVWGEEAELTAAPLDAEHHYSAFATRAVEEGEGGGAVMRGLPMSRLIADSGFERVDLLKVDIEGAEVELFKGDVSWLGRVGAIAIEFHGDSRRASGFDRLMRDYGFEIDDRDRHTVLALKASGAGDS